MGPNEALLTRKNCQLFRDFDFQVVNIQKPWSERSYVAFHVRDMFYAHYREGGGG